MNKLATAILLLMFTVLVFADDYNRVYNPTPNVSNISSSGFMGEFDAISLVMNGNLDSTNIKDGSLTGVDLLANTIPSSKIQNGSLLPIDIANVDDITTGGMIFGASAGVFDVVTIGTTGQVLTVSGGLPIWSSPSSSGWSDTGDLLHPDSDDDNVAIGGDTAGTAAKAVLVIYNNTVPTDSVVDGVQMYAEDVTASSELKVRDEAGNVTTISPHNVSLIPQERIVQYNKDKTPYWTYYSRRDNMEINVDMYGAVKALEGLSDKQFIFERDITKEVN